MLGSLFLFALLFLGIAVVLFAGTLLLQGAIYSEPASNLVWRAPAAGLVMTLCFAAWSFMAYRAPGNYNTLFEFSTSDDEPPYKQFWSVKRGNETQYVSKLNSRGRLEYRDPKTNKTWSRSDSEGVVEAIIVEDNGQKIRFETELNPDRSFKAASGEPVRYVETGEKTARHDG